jgi:hypothetical protein
MSARGDRLLRKRQMTAVCSECGAVYWVKDGHRCKPGKHRKGQRRG